MADLEKFDPNDAGNPNNNIFGLPFTEEEARLVILPVPWEVSVSYGVGTARNTDHVFKASLQVDLYDHDAPDAWKEGYYMRPYDQKVLLKNDYLRKEAELYINYISQGEALEANQFMCKTLKEVNEGGNFLNNWVYEQTRDLLENDKLVVVLGGDHSVPLGYYKALAEKHDEFCILQIDAHCDLRDAYEGFKYSHASIMYNALAEIPQITKLVQVGIRDFSDGELEYINQHEDRIVTFFDHDIKNLMYEGALWKNIVDDIIVTLPQKIYLSFDIDGLDPKLCPNTGTPVAGGFETEQIYYLVRKIIESGKQLIGFDLVEIGVAENNWDANVGARILYKLCNFLIRGNPAK